MSLGKEGKLADEIGFACGCPSLEVSWSHIPAITYATMETGSPEPLLGLDMDWS